MGFYLIFLSYLDGFDTLRMVSVLTSINSFFLLIKQDFRVSYDDLELNKDKYTTDTLLSPENLIEDFCIWKLNKTFSQYSG